jgi:hypothetical protein
VVFLCCPGGRTFDADFGTWYYIYLATLCCPNLPPYTNVIAQNPLGSLNATPPSSSLFSFLQACLSLLAHPQVGTCLWRQVNSPLSTLPLPFYRVGS